MNQTENERLVHAVNALRPDWPTGSLRTFVVAELRGRPFRDAMVAMAWVACDPQTRTPRRVLEAGPWWTATLTVEGASAPRPVAFADLCHHCGSVPQRCRSELVQVIDPHPYRTAQDAAVERARDERRRERAQASGGWSPTSALDPGRPSAVRRAELRAGLEVGRAAQAARQAELDRRYLARLGAAGPGSGQPGPADVGEHGAQDPDETGAGVRDDEVPDPGERGEQAADEVVVG